MVLSIVKFGGAPPSARALWRRTVAASGPRAGVCFTFTLPSVEESEGGAVGRFPPVSTRREDKEGDGRVRVLAVDDDPQDLRYVRDTLAKSGYDTILTGEPEEALRLVEDEKPECWQPAKVAHFDTREIRDFMEVL